MTVIFLTYNHEKTIAKAFDSILEQKTNFDFDIYVLEDCSTDRTADICREYKEKYPDKVRLFLNEKNLGVTRNFKQGLLKIKSKYFAFLEGDDYWCDKRKLQKQIDILEQNPEYTICGHNNLVKDHITNSNYLNIQLPSDKLKSKYSIDDKFGVHPSTRVYRNVINWQNLPSYMVFDSHIYLVYLTKGDLYYINEVMSVYNKTSNSFWSGKSYKQRKLFSLKLRYQANKLFNFKYDYKYYPHKKFLKIFKKIFGLKAGWYLFYHIEVFRLNLKYLFD